MAQLPTLRPPAQLPWLQLSAEVADKWRPLSSQVLYCPARGCGWGGGGGAKGSRGAQGRASWGGGDLITRKLPEEARAVTE